MKKIILSLVFLLGVCFSSYAERETITTTGYKASQLVKRGEAKVYSISFIATAAGGNFIISDAITASTLLSTLKAEGSEATSKNSSFQDFKDRPLELSTGLYLTITDGYLILRYE